MSEHIYKAHNVSALLYHLVCSTKYRRAVITDEVDAVLKRVCFDISNRYEVVFLEIGADRDHVHFLVQSVRAQLWGGAFWSSGYYFNTVGRHGSEETIRQYVSGQGRQSEYHKWHSQQLELF